MRLHGGQSGFNQPQGLCKLHAWIHEGADPTNRRGWASHRHLHEGVDLIGHRSWASVRAQRERTQSVEAPSLDGTLIGRRAHLTTPSPYSYYHSTNITGSTHVKWNPAAMATIHKIKHS
eukprot:1157380-Pelagomonas_calceolata.AAC.16